MFIKWFRDKDRNVIVHDTEWTEIIYANSIGYRTTTLFKAIFDIYKRRNKFSSRMITRLYLSYYSGTENLPYISSYLEEDAPYLFDSKEEQEYFIPCAINYIPQLKKEISFRGK